MGAPDLFYIYRFKGGGGGLEDFDARESVASWFSQGQRSRIKKAKLEELAIRGACDCNGG